MTMPAQQPDNTDQHPDNQGKRLLAIAAEIRVFRTPGGEVYARFLVNGKEQTYMLRSKFVKGYLVTAYAARHETVPNATALEGALSLLEGKAYMQERTQDVFVRVAPHGDDVYLDLCNDKWEAVRITPSGWNVVQAEDVPVNFRRTKGALPLPKPERGGTLGELRDLINIGSDDNWTLLVAWLLSTLHPTGPYPALTFVAEQGSAKSTTARFVRGLVDPAAVPLFGMPSSSADVTLKANSNWVVAFDNLSYIPQWLSDDLCLLSTGGGSSKKQLYTDSDEVLFNAKRPTILTGISDLASRGDLLERMLLISLPTIDSTKRRDERSLNEQYQAARRRILGALLDAAACALKNYRTVKLDRLPRMADFAKWVVAAEPALGWEPGSFMAVYEENREDATSLEIEASSLASAVVKLMEGKDSLEDKASELLKLLEAEAGEKATKQPSWPKSAARLSSSLRIVGNALRRVGIETTTSKSNGVRRITITRKQTLPDDGESRDARDARDASAAPLSILALSGKKRVNGAVAEGKVGDTSSLSSLSSLSSDDDAYEHCVNPTEHIDTYWRKDGDWLYCSECLPF